MRLQHRARRPDTPTSGRSPSAVIGSCCGRGKGTTCASSACACSSSRRITSSGFATSSAIPSRSSTGSSRPTRCASSATSSSSALTPFPARELHEPWRVPFPPRYDPLETAIVGVYPSPTYVEDVAPRAGLAAAALTADPEDAEGTMLALCRRVFTHGAVSAPPREGRADTGARHSRSAAGRAATWRR